MALAYDLRENGLFVQTQVPIAVTFCDVKLDAGFRADLIVENKVIVEIKSIEEIGNIHQKQLLTYLKLSGIKLGILVNFNTDYIEKSIHRKINGYL